MFILFGQECSFQLFTGKLNVKKLYYTNELFLKYFSLDMNINAFIFLKIEIEPVSRKLSRASKFILKPKKFREGGLFANNKTKKF